jgi:hypothetical protein
VSENHGNATLTPNSRRDGSADRVVIGLFVRRPRWGLSGRGWLVAIAAAGLSFSLLLVGIHPFLGVTQRVHASDLVVEGWIDHHAIKAAAKEYSAQGYVRVLATGGPVVGLGGYVNDFQTAASFGVDRLRAAGIPPDRVHMVPSKVAGRDRTYNSALALRAWFRDHRLTVTSFNVLTENVHSRRTRLLYQKAFGGEVKVGIISVPNPDYDPRRWWHYSEGVREVLGETLAYMYVRFFFWP